MPYRDKLVGIGLASSELGHPPEKFARVFAKARALGFKLVAHAGEEGPPAYIWSALDDLRVERIDHGVQAMQDRALVARLVKDKVPLTVCPLSNLKLRVFPTLAQHNLGQMLDAGLVATMTRRTLVATSTKISLRRLKRWAWVPSKPTNWRSTALTPALWSRLPSAPVRTPWQSFLKPLSRLVVL
jgi:hypothetical protein